MATTINATDLNNTVDPLKTITPKVDATNYGGIIDSAMTSLPELTKTVEDGANTQSSSIDRINKLMDSTLTKTADTARANEEAGVNKAKEDYNTYSQQLNDINANITGLANEAKAIPLKVQENALAGSTRGGNAPVNADMLRTNAIKALTQSSLADVLTANINNSVIRYNMAKEKSQQAIDLKYKPIEDEIANLKEQLKLNKDYITDPADIKRLEAQELIINERERLLTEKKETEKDISSVKLEIAKNGGDPNLVNGATSLSDAIDKAGSSLKTPSTEVIKLGDNQAYLIDKTTGKIIRAFGGGGGTGTGGGVGINNSAYSGIVKTILGSGKFTKDQATAVANAINSGDDPFTVIKNNARTMMGSNLSTETQNYETAKKVMVDLQGQLEQYYKNGGKTNLFNGSYEKTLNKLGEVNDPKLVEIATQIASSLQSYRNAVSGTAYSVQEGKEIATVFPSINKSQGLNNATINGRLKSFDSVIDSNYGNVLGQDTYNSLKNIKTVSEKEVQKGTLTDNDYVKKAFTLPVNSKIGNYQTVVNNTPAGQIPVVDNATGQIGWVPIAEFNSSTYTKL